MVVSLADADEDTPTLVRELVQAGARIQRVASLDSGLEAAYLTIVGGDSA